WTAYQLRLRGANVLLVDSYGPGNSRASSGGESRMIRLGYGPDEIYSRSAQRSLSFWQELFEQTNSVNLFQKTGILWLARAQDPYCEATLRTLQQLGAKYERLDHDELVRRFPQLEPGPIAWAILEPESGVLMARRAVQAVAMEARANGVEYIEEAITPPEGKLNFIETTSGTRIVAGQFVFACGPWLPKLFPDLLGGLIHVTRQEVGSLVCRRVTRGSNQGHFPRGLTSTTSFMDYQTSTAVVSRSRSTRMDQNSIPTPASGLFQSLD